MIKVFIVTAIVNNSSFIELLTQFFMGFLSGKSDPNTALHWSTETFSPKMLPEMNVL